MLVPQLIKNTTNHYEYPERWAWLDDCGKQIYGCHFRLYEEDAELILKLMAWFSKDRNTAIFYGLDINKGILLNGPIGCGKTALMNLFACAMKGIGGSFFRMKSCREIAFDFAGKGHEILPKYTNLSYLQGNRISPNFCFDDLGLETEMQFYGNPCNVMAEIMLSRYDLFINHQIFTHATTNLSSSEIEKRYGQRVRSRCREMFNLISFDAKAKDKRV